jgi:DNA-binding MarR family transcriptional regulator
MSKTVTAVEAWESLFRAQVLVLRDLGAQFPEDLRLNAYGVLFALSQQKERRLRIRDLTEHMFITQPSISRMIDRLAARGLVTKGADPSDARGIIVQMTDAGFDVFRRVAAQRMNAMTTRVGGGRDGDGVAGLTRLCTKLRLGQ